MGAELSGGKLLTAAITFAKRIKQLPEPAVGVLLHGGRRGYMQYSRVIQR